jgi:hypothetical protein
MCTHLEACWTGFFFSFFFTFFFFIHSLFLGPLVEMGPRHVPRMPMPRSGPGYNTLFFTLKCYVSSVHGNVHCQRFFLATGLLGW